MKVCRKVSNLSEGTLVASKPLVDGLTFRFCSRYMRFRVLFSFGFSGRDCVSLDYSGLDNGNFGSES